MCAKVAIVTGSNKGLGLEIVRILCSKFNGDVYLTSRNEDRGLEAVKQLESDGLKVKYHQLDIDNIESIKQLRNYMVSSYGGIDVLVNNAGIQFSSKDSTPFAVQVAATLKTNFFNTLDISKMFLPHINSNGRVVNISSIYSKVFLAKCSAELQNVFRSDSITEEQLVAKMKEYVAAAEDGSLLKKGWSDYAYAVSKIGVTVMSRIHAKWLREQDNNDILLNSCCPGWISSSMGGSRAPKTPAEGAETPIYLALLPVGTIEPHGQFVVDKVVEQW